MDWDCEDCSLLVSRRNSGGGAIIVEPPAVPTVSFENLPPRMAMKRSHPSDGVSTSHSEGTSYPGDSHVGVISIADSHLPSPSMNCLSKLPIL